jgi:hypothetical protein
MGMSEPTRRFPESVTLDEAYRSAFYLVAQYVELEKSPNVDLVVLLHYLWTEPTRWTDWLRAVRRGLADGGIANPNHEGLWEIRPDMPRVDPLGTSEGFEDLPGSLTLDEAHRGAFYLIDTYLNAVAPGSTGLVLLHHYLWTDPARWHDWLDAVERALVDGGVANANHEGRQEVRPDMPLRPRD